MESQVPVGQAAPRFDAVERAIDRHRANPSRAPLPEAQREAFARVQTFLAGSDGNWYLDAGCGTGVSSHRLAQRLEARVVGVDRSAARLERGARSSESPHPGALTLRADVPALLRQMRAAEVRARGVYLLYPNPSPKSAHLGRRWHAHPCFEDLLAAAPRLELRTNWSVYAEEFAHALRFRLGRPHLVETLAIDAGEALTPFEAKYHRSGHTLYRVLATTERVDLLASAAS